LKRLEDAERDADRIYAVIRGIGTSSDGKSQSIYAPRPDGQARALIEAYRNAGISPDTVGLVEAHGTGTRVGDEMEFIALKKVFGADQSQRQPLRTGVGEIHDRSHQSGGRRCRADQIGTFSLQQGTYAHPQGRQSLTRSWGSSPVPFTSIPPPGPGLAIENGTPRSQSVSVPSDSAAAIFMWCSKSIHPDKKEIAWDGSVEILAFSATG
jgi:hypothetical protein